jgi:hypothetical protein
MQLLIWFRLEAAGKRPGMEFMIDPARIQEHRVQEW